MSFELCRLLLPLVRLWLLGLLLLWLLLLGVAASPESLRRWCLGDFLPTVGDVEEDSPIVVAIVVVVVVVAFGVLALIPLRLLRLLEVIKLSLAVLMMDRRHVNNGHNQGIAQVDLFHAVSW